MAKLKYRINQYMIYQNDDNSYVYAPFVHSCIIGTHILNDDISADISKLPHQYKSAITQLNCIKNAKSCTVDVDGNISNIVYNDEENIFDITDRLEQYFKSESFKNSDFEQIIKNMILVNSTDFNFYSALKMLSEDSIFVYSEYKLHKMGYVLNDDCKEIILPIKRTVSLVNNVPVSKVSQAVKEKILLGEIIPTAKTLFEYYVYYDISDTNIDYYDTLFENNNNLNVEVLAPFFEKCGINLIYKDMKNFGEKSMLIDNKIFVEHSLEYDDLLLNIVNCFCKFLVNETSTQSEIVKQSEMNLLMFMICDKYNITIVDFNVDVADFYDIEVSVNRCFNMLKFFENNLVFEDYDEEISTNKYKNFTKKGGN